MVGEKFVRVRETRIDLRILSWYYCYDLIKMFIDYISGDAYTMTGQRKEWRRQNDESFYILCFVYIDISYFFLLY